MSKILRKIRAGRVVFAVVYTPCTAGDSPKARAQKRKASTAAREKLNARTSFQKLEQTLAANFDDGDLFVTLTYDDKHLPDSRDKAVRKIRSFLSKLRKAWAERGEELHYIYVTEGACPGGCTTTWWSTPLVTTWRRSGGCGSMAIMWKCAGWPFIGTTPMRIWPAT